MQPDCAETVDFYRIDASLKLDPQKRSGLGQYLTPVSIGRFMASLFDTVSDKVRLLDPGAGVGSLSAAFIERCSYETKQPRSVSLDCYEIESVFIDYLESTLKRAKIQGRAANIDVTGTIHTDDFILSSAHGSQTDLFQSPESEDALVTHVIMNPPYKKIHSASAHRSALCRAGIETSNLYTGFLFLAALRLVEGGEMVAIVPRSFCNGPYFKPFREQFFSLMSVRHVHVFEKRDAAFEAEEVLQEKIILHAVKGGASAKVRITTSGDCAFVFDPESQAYVAEDMTQRLVDSASVIRPDDPDKIVHIASTDFEQGIVNRMAHFTASLSDLGMEVSTGPVVDFRLCQDLRAEPGKGTVPLLYATHFRGGSLEWPKTTKKPNAIAVTEKSRKWLYPNEGHFVVTRRFTSKEEKQRVVASVYSSDLPGEMVGFENHLNVFHANRKGVSPSLAYGLSVYLNSSLVDLYFRQFNGHTQVNAADLRSLHYPTREMLERLGKKARKTVLSRQEIDDLIEGELALMTAEENPLLARQKIEEALQIVRALGMPRGQQNERSALTLLALLNLKPSGAWAAVEKPLMGITPIMEYCREHYGREYAPNTRETFRRQTMHQFVEVGIALYNPDRPDRPVNSPKACYQISAEAFAVIQTFGTDAWPAALDAYLAGRETLAAKWAKQGEMQMIPVQVAEGQEITLTPGAHSELIKAIITEFAPRFAPDAEVIYVGDTGDKIGYFQEQRLAELGVTIDQHGKMPDVVLYFGEKDWLLLVESVTSHGPVDAKRHNELGELFAGATHSLVYVTAFPNRSVMARYLGEISWETEVWCADAPTHLIHFNGERFLGPYEM